MPTALYRQEKSWYEVVKEDACLPEAEIGNSDVSY